MEIGSKKVRILWISMYPPISTASSGGSQTFNYYFKQFINDERFEIRLISCGRFKERKDVDNELSYIDPYMVYWGDPAINPLDKIKNIESKYNLWNKNACLISNTDVEKIEQRLLTYSAEDYNPDVVILEWTSIVMLAGIIRRIFPKAKIVASEHDVTFVGYHRKRDYYTGVKRLIWELKYRNEKKRELQNLEFCDLILPHNSDNKALLESEGVKTEKIKGLIPYYTDMTATIRHSNQRDILFFGAMAREENSLSAKWFIDNVLPRLEDLNIRFVILGSNPPAYLKEKESDRIHITGFVDSIEPYFANSMCLAAPLVLGAGIKIKILEALSSGIPVLTNEIGIEGIPAVNGREFFLCQKPEDYERIIREIYNFSIDTKTIEKAAKMFVKENFSYSDFCKFYRDKIAELGE